MYIGIAQPFYSLALFSPTIIAKLGYTNANANLLSVPPYVLGFITTLAVGWMSDRSMNRGKRQYKQIGERVALDVALNEIDKGVPMGFEPLESEVGWDFEENVGYEEDGESDIVLLSAQL